MKVLHVFTLATTAESFFDGQFAYLSEAGYDLHLVSSTEPSQDFCARNKVTFHKIDIARKVDLKADIRSILALRRLIKRERFNAVVGHTPKGALVAMCAARISGVKTRIYYRHGLIYTTAAGLKRRIFKSVEQFTAALATNIVNVSPSLSVLAVKDRLNGKRKQTVIGSGTCGGIDALDIFNPDKLSTSGQAELKRQIIGDCDFVVGFCGRLCKDKGIGELVEGFKLFQSIHPEIKSRLLLVGPFDERDILANDVKSEIASNPDIIAIGRQPKSKLPNLYALMDVFVFPSYREGFGMSVIEASAMQVPILVSRSHGCVDSIVENVTGRYIDISAESIAENLTYMLNKQVREKMGVKGREFATQNFEQTIMWPKILQLYHSVLQ